MRGRAEPAASARRDHLETCNQLSSGASLAAQRERTAMTTKTMLAPLLGLSFGLLSFVGVAAAADPPPAAPGKPVIDATTAPKLPARAKIDWEKMNESQRKKYM